MKAQPTRRVPARATGPLRQERSLSARLGRAAPFRRDRPAQDPQAPTPARPSRGRDARPARRRPAAAPPAASEGLAASPPPQIVFGDERVADSSRGRALHPRHAGWPAGRAPGPPRRAAVTGRDPAASSSGLGPRALRRRWRRCAARWSESPSAFLRRRTRPRLLLCPPPASSTLAVTARISWEALLQQGASVGGGGGGSGRLRAGAGSSGPKKSGRP